MSDDTATSPSDDGAELPGYAESLDELQSILATLESNTADVDLLAERVQRADLLIRHCRSRLDDARFLARNSSAYAEGRTRELSADPAALMAVNEVVRKRIPLVVGADRAADIEALLRLAGEQDIQQHRGQGHHQDTNSKHRCLGDSGHVSKGHQWVEEIVLGLDSEASAGVIWVKRL